MADTSSGLLMRLRDRADGDAWARLVHLYSPLLHGWLHRYAVPAEDADDVVQDVLLAAVRELPDFRYDRSRGSFRGWLRTVLVHRLRDHQRSRRHQPPTVGDGELDRLEDPQSDLSGLWAQEHDRHVMSRLLELVRLDFEPATWEAFRRTALEGEAASAVAENLGLSADALYAAKHRVLNRLRQEAGGLIG